MTVLRRGLAAQQDGLLLEALSGEDRFDLSGADETEIGLRVSVPASLVLLECVQHLLRGGELGLVFIGCAADFFQEVGQVSLLGKRGELGRVVQPHVEQPLNAVSLQCAEELAGAFLGKTDAVDLHLSSSSSAKSAGWLATNGFRASAATESSES